MGEIVDIIIIGAGPAGLSAAVNAVTRGKTVRIFSNRENYLSKAERVDNHLGFYHASGRELMDKFKEHAEAMGIKIEKGMAVNILSFGESFMVNINGEISESKKIILAMGISKIKELPGEDKLLGSGVSYCATCDAMLYKNKKAVVWDQSKDAWEEANFLQSIGANVTFISNKPEPEHLSNDIKFIKGTITEIIGENTVEAVNTGNEVIKTDAVFMLRDAVAPSALIDGLELDGNFININKHMETNIPGVYAAGDITGKPLQLSKAISEGLIAAQHAALQIDKKENLNGRKY
ncbi:MAG: NAD(P)/FAD-dependent oxidoreductase [Tissierellia bacterium]|jgi:thioredoxin reductase (NADPH)|nr:NAD(P)/FAD-dependent oxidoreductase [Tissierellia bacterium]MDD3225997.1 NAD(P)/FAD-dependent oxidoreductase [Tissierellia bacterium]MDD3750490.1 NAD(P)/FAD-dependent oxidoreductase [Tissierellia bacterium]MDD4046410.1 NAD(P)/FAD-dependent oxidoreductase [Tissierellia bacterium]MDD4677845.1 NAD(P)/FAD-dependent oxidoreductase [Tissierellia bacterium]